MRVNGMNAKWHVEDEYRANERHTLRAGDGFRASGGPYYKTRDGVKIYMGDRGTYTFVDVVVQGRRRWVRGRATDGVVTMIYVGPRYKSPETELVYAPHKIVAKRRAMGRASR
jgi:hypothetical protein